MRKLSKITESIWSDIQDRSSGDTVRKENQWIMDLIKEFIERHNLEEKDYHINIPDYFFQIQITIFFCCDLIN